MSHMKPLGPTNDHILLVQGMAKAVGADLNAAHAAGTLDQEQWANMITRCRGCTQPGDCGDKLRSVEGVDEAPGYCRNTEVLNRLKVG